MSGCHLGFLEKDFKKNLKIKIILILILKFFKKFFDCEMVVGFLNKVKKAFTWIKDHTIGSKFGKTIINSIGTALGVPGLTEYVEKGAHWIDKGLDTARIVANNYEQSKKKGKKYKFFDGVKDVVTHIQQSPDELNKLIKLKKIDEIT
jgi:hypothetical protein